MQSVLTNDGLEPRRVNSGVWGLGNPVIAASLARQQDTSSPEFQIQNEDFPALPGTANVPINLDSNAAPVNTLNEATEILATTGQSSEPKNHSNGPGIATDAEGGVWNIPPGMICDQFGMAGMLTYLRAVENPGVVSLALGYDLTTLGVNLGSSTRDIYTTFGGPWADSAILPHNLDKEPRLQMPTEYLTNVHVREKLPPVKLNKVAEDVLFFLFYNCPGEVYQLAAANELFTRDWRFHKIEKLWVTRFLHSQPKEQTSAYEKGRYNVFDHVTWRKIPREMKLEYSQLDDKPKLPHFSLQMMGSMLRPGSQQSSSSA